jgi:hypothetical protein
MLVVKPQESPEPLAAARARREVGERVPNPVRVDLHLERPRGPRWVTTSSAGGRTTRKREHRPSINRDSATTKRRKANIAANCPVQAAIQLRPFCFYWGYSDRGRQHFRRRAYDELVEALIARGLPFALTTGHGQESIDQRYRAQSRLRKPFDFATFRRTIDELMAPSGLGAGARNASPAGPISATR